MPRLPIDHQITFLYTAEMVATTHFYEDLLGLPLELDQGTCRIYRASSAGFIGFCERDGATPPTSDVILTIVTPEVDGWYQHLCDLGVVFEKPPALNPKYNIYHCFLRDPNGYLLEIQEFLDPAWDPGAES
jgi:catechol 2,3-dioxygenase-like lactoylglutathione lyase family enzyme